MSYRHRQGIDNTRYCHGRFPDAVHGTSQMLPEMTKTAERSNRVNNIQYTLMRTSVWNRLLSMVQLTCPRPKCNVPT